MHDHDLDLIAEYADGVASDPSGVEELLATCSTCAAEYRTQIEIRQLVGSVGVTPMNEIERARVRRNVWETGGFEVRSRTARWWERRGLQLASAAAIVFVGVGLVGVLGQLQGNDQGTTAAELPDLAEAPLAGADREAAFDASDTEEAAMETSDDALAASALRTTVRDLGEVDLDGLKLAIDDLLGADSADAMEPTAPADEGDSAEDGSQSYYNCELPPSAFTLTATMEGRPIVVAVGIEDPDVDAAAFWTDTCEPFDLG